MSGDKAKLGREEGKKKKKLYQDRVNAQEVTRKPDLFFFSSLFNRHERRDGGRGLGSAGKDIKIGEWRPGLWPGSGQTSPAVGEVSLTAPYRTPPWSGESRGIRVFPRGGIPCSRP